MRILITGGYGFIGGNLADYLEKKSHQIFLTYRKSDHIKNIFKNKKINSILWDENFNFLRALEKIDCVIHLAGPNALECEMNPYESIEFRKISTSSLMNFAYQSDVAKFIYISTAHVYKNPLVGKISEETEVLNDHPYAISHLAAEKAIQTFSSANKIIKIILRVSNLFGVPVHKGNDCWKLVINDLCKQAVQTRELRLKTDGHTQRNFLNMIEFCSKVEQIIEIKNELMESGVYNLGSNKTMTISDLALIIQKRCFLIFGFKPEIFITQNDCKKTNDVLIYKNNKLEKFLSKKTKNLFISEIDELLKYCKLEFA